MIISCQLAIIIDLEHQFYSKLCYRIPLVEYHCVETFAQGENIIALKLKLVSAFHMQFENFYAIFIKRYLISEIITPTFTC